MARMGVFLTFTKDQLTCFQVTQELIFLVACWAMIDAEATTLVQFIVRHLSVCLLLYNLA